ncbi:hypothetical protein KAS42_01505 [bacterium]|nr:hypothetical protein [bacterium]
MKYNDIEKELSNFTFKEPEQNLRNKILLKAGTVWIEKQPVPVFTHEPVRHQHNGETVHGYTPLEWNHIKRKTTAIRRWSSTFRLIRNYAYGLAMLFLISIVSSKIDSSLTDKLIGGKTTLVAKTIEKSNGIENLCSDLGIDCKTYKLLAGMVKIGEDKNKLNIFDQRDKLMKELNLTNGGLS